jgi:hypothetical protein
MKVLVVALSLMSLVASASWPATADAQWYDTSKEMSRWGP